MKLVRNRLEIGKAFVNIYIFDGIDGHETTEDFSNLVKDDEHMGFAGFSEREHLKNLLDFYHVKGTDNPWIDLKDIVEIVKGCLTKCVKEVPLEEIHIFFFPTTDSFIRDRMEGIAGDCFWKNTILIFIHPESNLTRLPKTIVHEYSHAYSLNHMQRKTLSDHIVFEGLAENFVLSVIGEENTWSQALDRNKSMEIFRNLKEQLRSTNNSLYRNLFFGQGEYPLWSGYSIGYLLVSDYLKKNKETDWAKLMRTPVENIINESGWL